MKISGQKSGRHLTDLLVHTGNGHGSTNNKIRRFTTFVAHKLGGAIEYTDSATAGAAFTIKKAGFYVMSYSDRDSLNSSTLGISVNSPSLGTTITNQSPGDVVGETQTVSQSIGNVSGGRYLIPGDVVRPHTDGVFDGANNRTKFRIIGPFGVN